MKRPLCLAILLTMSCRGGVSADPPFHLVPDMDWQPKYEPLEESKLFADGRTMRPAVEGTVAVGALKEDDAYYRGKSGDAYVARIPVEVTAALIDRGQERYNIFCSPCHDQTGGGRGMVVRRGFPPPIDLASDRVKGLADGEIFEVITNGRNNMPSYRNQVPEADRWAIISWVRVLGHSQHGSVDDVPSDKRGSIEPKAGTP